MNQHENENQTNKPKTKTRMKKAAVLIIITVAGLLARASNTNEIVEEIQVGDSTYRNAYVLSASKTNVVLKFDGGGKSFKPWELPEPFRSRLFTKTELQQLKSESEARPQTRSTPPPIQPGAKIDWDQERQKARVAIVAQI